MRGREMQLRFCALDIVVICILCMVLLGGCGMVCDDVHKMKGERQGSE